MTTPQKSTDKSDLSIVTPFKREQVRWALSRYRKNKKIGVPRLLNQIIDRLGEEIADQISTQDIYNFLEKGKDARAFKVRIFHRFLEQVDSEYVDAPSFADYAQKTADFISGFTSNLSTDSNSAVYEEKLIELIDGRTFCSFMKVGELDQELSNDSQYTFLGLHVNFISFVYPGAGFHINAHSFSIYLDQARFNRSVNFEHTKHYAKNPKTFLPEQIEKALQYINALEFTDGIPIQHKRSGVVIGGLTYNEYDNKTAYVAMLRGVEAGIMFRTFKLVEPLSEHSPPVKLSFGVGIGNLERTPFDDAMGNIAPGIVDRYVNSPHAGHPTSKPPTMYFPIENPSIEEFVAKFQWYSVQ